MTDPSQQAASYASSLWSSGALGDMSMMTATSQQPASGYASSIWTGTVADTSMMPTTNQQVNPTAYASSAWTSGTVADMSMYGNTLINSPMGPMRSSYVTETSYPSYTDGGDYGVMPEKDYMYNDQYNDQYMDQSSWKIGAPSYRSYYHSDNSYNEGRKFSRRERDYYFKEEYGMKRRGNRGAGSRGNWGSSSKGYRGKSPRGDRDRVRGKGRGGRGGGSFRDRKRSHSESKPSKKQPLRKKYRHAEPYNPEEPTNEEEQDKEPKAEGAEDRAEEGAERKERAEEGTEGAEEGTEGAEEATEGVEDDQSEFGAKAPSQDETKTARRKNWCTVCESIFAGSFLVHRRTKEHRKHRDKKYPRCRLCRITFHGMKDFEIHSATEEHLKKSEDFQALKEQQLLHAALSDSEDDATSIKKFIASQSHEKTVFRENDDPAAMRYVVPLKVYFCKLCKKLFKNHTAGIQVHCRTVDHIQKYKTYFEGKEARAAVRKDALKAEKEAARLLAMANKKTVAEDDDVEYVEEEVEEGDEIIEEEEAMMEGEENGEGAALVKTEETSGEVEAGTKMAEDDHTENAVDEIKEELIESAEKELREGPDENMTEMEDKHLYTENSTKQEQSVDEGEAEEKQMSVDTNLGIVD